MLVESFEHFIEANDTSKENIKSNFRKKSLSENTYDLIKDLIQLSKIIVKNFEQN